MTAATAHAPGTGSLHPAPASPALHPDGAALTTLATRPRSTSQCIALADAMALPGMCAEWAPTLQCVLFSEREIRSKVRCMAADISAHYRSKLPADPVTGKVQPLLCVGLLTGAIMFVTDLLRHLSIPYEVDFLVVSSYGRGATTTSGSVKLKKDLSIDPKGRHVLVIEDLIDTGLTLAWIKQHLRAKDCLEVKLTTLLDKTVRRTVKGVDVDWVGFECPDEFVIGYGCDYNDEYRCLPWIGVLKPEAYQNPHA